MGAGDEHNSFVNSGQASGVVVGGTGNRVEVGPVRQDQAAQLQTELREVLARLEAGRHNAQELQDVEQVRTSLAHAEAGRSDEALSALRGVGRWVLGVAREAGASVLTKELTTLLT